jgi:23S rRNA (guanine745-N1)-methyltransferase
VHPDALAMLACPHCGSGLTEAAGSLRCENGHSFDVARQGYVNLLPGPAPYQGDTAEMVAARADFLDRGHLAPLQAALATATGERAGEAPGGIVDAGGGTGHHLAAVLDRAHDRPGVCLDLSRHAVRRAARVHPRVGAAVCDVWTALPVRDDAAAAVQSVFAPRNGAEIARVLAPGGAAVVVSPTERHLHELVARLGMVSVDARKRERVDAALAPLQRAEDSEVEFTLDLAADEAEELIAMGPSAHHLSRNEIHDALRGGPAEATVSVEVAVFAQD